MSASLIDFLAGGLLQFGWWEMLLYLLVVSRAIYLATQTQDTFSLRGFTAATEDAAKRCQ